MKRINRYAALRIPQKIDYEYNINTGKRLKKMKLYQRRHIKIMENITDKKLSVTCYLIDGKLVISCPLCHTVIDSSDVGSRRYGCCKNCNCIYDTESKVAMKYYKKYLPDAYHKIEERRLNNRNARHRLEAMHKKEREERYLKKLYPLITVWNENGKEEIVTHITKEIKESKEFSPFVREILIKLQIPIDRYKILNTLGVYFELPESESVDVKNKKCNNKKEGDLR